MDDENQFIQVPDFVVRHVGLVQLQLAAAQNEIQRLNEELALLRARARPGAVPSDAGSVPDRAALA